MNTPATWFGLVLALGGPPGVAIVGNRLIGGPQSALLLLLGQASLWFLFAVILTVVVRAERLSLASIGVRRPGWPTLVWGLGLTFLLFVVSPAMGVVVERLGLTGFEPGLEQLRATPPWFRWLAALTGGVVEETLYRGYALERLLSITGRRWLAATIVIAAFGLAHLPSWGPGPTVAAFGGGVVLTLAYLRRRDLLANALAHVLSLILGMVLFL